MMRLRASLVLALIIFILDFATKRWVESELIYGQQILYTSFFNTGMADPRTELIRTECATYYDFPKPGIVFR